MLILKRKIQIRIAENISLMSCHCDSPIILLEQGDNKPLQQTRKRAARR